MLAMNRLILSVLQWFIAVFLACCLLNSSLIATALCGLKSDQTMLLVRHLCLNSGFIHPDSFSWKNHNISEQMLQGEGVFLTEKKRNIANLLTYPHLNLSHSPTGSLALWHILQVTCSLAAGIRAMLMQVCPGSSLRSYICPGLLDAYPRDTGGSIPIIN